jgi:MoaA/NifB/PqqE/SkfB family radical SAM enzyme
MSKKIKLHSSIIVTYRCNAKCNMCDAWKYPTKNSEEIGLDIIEKLPQTFFTNITGGEPFIRQDLPEIVEILKRKTKRIVISTNGYFTDRIVSLCERYPNIGIRISIEGLPKTNDEIRGIPDGFDRGLRTLLKLRAMGIEDIGFAMTVQDSNCRDLLPLYHLAKGLGYEFATATVHNSHYFHKLDNQIIDKKLVCDEIEKLIEELLRSNRPKDWFRAYFNFGLINYIYGNKRFLACDMGKTGFFVDPCGDILACNGMDNKQSMGNLNTQSWDEIWNSPRAQNIREMVKNCPKNCWMIGSAAPAIWHNLRMPAVWVLKNKLKLLRNKKVGFQTCIKELSK